MTDKRRTDNLMHLTGEELLGYHRRTLDGKEETLITQHLEGCELCSDALKGLAEMDDAMGIVNIIHDLKKRTRNKFTPKKKILYRFELITILISFFVIGLILFLGYYFIIVRH